MALPPKQKYLVLWSGGLGSTWALYTLLTRSDAQVCAHHVNKLCRDDNGESVSRTLDYERGATRAMLPWLQEHARQFDYSESFVDLTAFTTFARDTVTSLYFGAQAAMTWGFVPGDVILLGNDETEPGQPATEDLVRNRQRFRGLTYQGLVQAVMRSTHVPAVTWLTPQPTRQQQLKELPEGLAAETVSCRSPIHKETGGFAACGQCQKCRGLARYLPKYRRKGSDSNRQG